VKFYVVADNELNFIAIKKFLPMYHTIMSSLFCRQGELWQ